MIVTIAIAVGSALLHWLLQKQAVSRYEKCMKEAIRAAEAAKWSEIHSKEAKAMLIPALAALPKTRSRKTKSAGIGEPEQSA